MIEFILHLKWFVVQSLIYASLCSPSRFTIAPLLQFLDSWNKQPSGYSGYLLCLYICTINNIAAPKNSSVPMI